MRPVKKIVISLALVVPLAVLGFAHVAKTAPVITRFTPQAKWCGNASIVFFPGGPAGGVFANNVYNGAMVWGILSQPTRGMRTKGVVDALKKLGVTVDYLEIDAATNADPPAGTPTFTGYATSHRDVKLVVTDHGGLTATLETYLKSVGKKPGEVF